jgi:phosphonate transport system substrate-binding protein
VNAAFRAKLAIRAIVLIAGVLCAWASGAIAGAAGAPVDCPGDGRVRFGLLPAEDTLTMTDVYMPLAAELSRKLGCPVDVSVTTSYSTCVEAMRAKKLELASFGPLSYVLAHRVANAEAIAVQGDAAGKSLAYEATIVTLKGSGITTLREVAGHSFAFSDPASTSGHLLPAFALRAAGIDPDTGIHPFFAGSHTASFEALRNHKVEAGELNSGIIRVARASGEYDAAAFVTLWRSPPIPLSPLAVRGDLPAAFKTRLRHALYSIDLGAIADPKRVFTGKRYIAARDSDYDGIRTMVATLHVDLEHINE